MKRPSSYKVQYSCGNCCHFEYLRQSEMGFLYHFCKKNLTARQINNLECATGEQLLRYEKKIGVTEAGICDEYEPDDRG